MSKGDALKLIPNKIIYVLAPDKKLSSAATCSSFRRTPVDVVDWDDFVTMADSYTPSESPKLAPQGVFSKEARASNESDVVRALYNNVYSILEELVEGKFDSPQAVKPTTMDIRYD